MALTSTLELRHGRYRRARLRVPAGARRTNYGGKDADSQTGINGQTLGGGVLDLTPSYVNLTWVMAQQDATLNGAPAPVILTTDFFPAYIPSRHPIAEPGQLSDADDQGSAGGGVAGQCRNPLR